MNARACAAFARRLLGFAVLLGAFARAEDIRCVHRHARVARRLGVVDDIGGHAVTIRLAQGVYRVDGAAGETLGLFNSQPHPAT